MLFFINVGDRMTTVRLAIPNGHLSKETMDAFTRAGYKISGQERTYTPIINDHHIEVRILRPQEIPIFVAEGLQDIGVTGMDWIKETDADVEVILDLEYSRVRIVVAVPEGLKEVNTLAELLREFADRGRPLKIFTEYLSLTAKALIENPMYRDLYGSMKPTIVTPWWRSGSNPDVGIYLSFGATEAKPPTLADAIVEVVDTGTSLQQNNLKIIETLLDSTAVLVANPDSIRNPAKQEKICDVMTLLGGVVEAREKLHIFANVASENLKELLAELPALQKPTISSLSEGGWVAVNTVIDRALFLELVPTLRRLAQGLVVYEPRQVLPLDDLKIEGMPQ